MSLHAQAVLDTHDEIIVDLFAGGGGASSGIEEATGRMVDVAINHNPIAVALHEANHPQTKHYRADVFEVCPREVAQGRPIGLLWASPDCTYHSKARGSKPIRHANKKRRALAWVVTRWAAQVRPRVIMLENVEEFAQWGPLVGTAEFLKPCPKRRGKTFRKWVNSLRALGYQVEWRELRACDYGAPTIRKRLFVIARCDGEAIVWPEATHGPNREKPYVPVHKCIDWSLPMCSIFATKDEAKAWAKELGVPTPVRPLADKTMQRIARGVQRFVVDNPSPFIVQLGQTGGNGSYITPSDKPLTTVMTKADHCVVAPFTAGVGGRAGQIPERSIEEPLQTTTSKADTVIVAPFTATVAFGEGTGKNKRRGKGVRSVKDSAPTLTCSNGEALVAPFMVPRYGEREGQAPRCRSAEDPAAVIVPGGNGDTVVAANLISYHDEQGGNARANAVDGPCPTIDCANRLGITSEGCGKCGLVYSLLSQYNGTSVGQAPDDPLATVTATDRFGVVTVMVQGVPHVIYDIGMRMLQPKELYLAQGFRPGYIFDRTADGKPITKSEQVKMVGNSVCPPLAKALARANCGFLIVPARCVA